VDWMAALKPSTSRIVDLASLSPDAERVVSEWGEGALAWAAEVGERLGDAIERDVPELGGNPAHARILRRGTTSSVVRAMLVVQGDDLDLITDEAIDAARDFAHRGLELPSVLRIIRIGTATMAGAFLEQAAQLLADTERAVEMRRLAELFFSYMDEFSGEMSEAFLAEKDRWAATAVASQLELVNDLLEGRPVDTRQAKRVLNYDLEPWHVAAVVWSDAAGSDRTDQLRTAAVSALRSTGATDVFVLPMGLAATWAWGAVDGEPGPVPSPPPGVYIAVSQGHPGVAGFVRAHHEATAVERLMRLAPSSVRVSGLRHADVELATLLCHDLEDTRHFVQRQLGRLAIDDRRTRRVRDTLRMYLDNERSVAKVAEQQYISRNTVTYRIKQAEQLSGRRLDRDQLNLHAALLLSELLGPRVLITAASNGNTSAPASAAQAFTRHAWRTRTTGLPSPRSGEST
jgi:hypothetical protein